MKKTIFLFGLLCVFAVSGYTAAPSEFPGAFVKQAQEAVDAAVESVKDLDALSSIIAPIAGMSNYASLKTVRSNLAELERMTMSEGSNAHIDAIRLAGLYKLTVPLVLKMNDRILDILSQIEELLSFWKEAQGYRVQFFLHRKSPKVIIHTLQRMQDELCALLGTLVQQINKAPFGQDRAVQYAWFKELCAQLNSDEASASIVMAQPVFETVAAMLTRATSFVLGFNNQMEKRLYQYGKPSWLRRNLGTVVATVGGGAALGVSADKCRDDNGDRYVQKAATTVLQHADMYRKACADALWGNDKKWADSIDVCEQEQIVSFKIKASQLLPEFTRNEADRDALAEQLVRQRLLDLEVITSDESSVDLSQVQFDSKSGALVMQRSRSGSDGASASSEVARVSSSVRKRSGSDGSVSAAASGSDNTHITTDLERVYCRLFGMKDLPAPKKCAVQLLDQNADIFTVDAMNSAAETRDLRYFLFLVAQPVAHEGHDLAEGIATAPSVLRDTELNEAHLIKAVLAEASEGTKLRHLLPNAPAQTRKKYKTPGAGVEAIAKGMDGRLGLLDTLAQVPDIGRLAYDIGYTKFEREKYELWKKMKLLVMIGISYFLYRVGKDVVAPPVSYVLKKMRIISYPYEGLFETLRELKKLLLVNGEKQQAEMDPCDVGLMYYLIYRLECVDVPAKYSTTFLHDVRLLQSPDLSAKQKYKVVKDVLQDGYPFLRPTGVTTK